MSLFNVFLHHISPESFVAVISFRDQKKIVRISMASHEFSFFNNMKFVLSWCLSGAYTPRIGISYLG